MKKLDSESYEDWVRRVEQYEYGRSLMQLAEGKDPEEVVKEASYRIAKKLQHPIIKSLTK